MWGSISESLCSLQEMDQREIRKNFMASEGYKISFQWLESRYLA